MEQEPLRQMRKPLAEKKADLSKVKPREGISVSGALPPMMQEAIRRNAEQAAQGGDAPPPTAASVMMQQKESPQQTMSHEPPLRSNSGSTGNMKLDELLAGIKETVFHYERLILPSLGKFYTQNTVPNDQGAIHVRCMTGEEETILATPRHIKKGQAISMIFKNCVREAISPDQLLTIDRTHLLIFLRGISYGPDYEAEVRCSECNGPKFNTTINLDALSVRYCPEDYSPDMLNDVLPTSGYKFSYRLATNKDDNEISNYRERMVTQYGDQGADNSWNHRAAILINDVEGLREKPALQTLLSKLPINDVAYIRNCINEPPFGVNTKVPLLCPFCNEEFVIEMPMETGFFFPKPRRARSIQA